MCERTSKVFVLYLKGLQIEQKYILKKKKIGNFIFNINIKATRVF